MLDFPSQSQADRPWNVFGLMIDNINSQTRLPSVFHQFLSEVSSSNMKEYIFGIWNHVTDMQIHFTLLNEANPKERELLDSVPLCLWTKEMIPDNLWLIVWGKEVMNFHSWLSDRPKEAVSLAKRFQAHFCTLLKQEYEQKCKKEKVEEYAMKYMHMFLPFNKQRVCALNRWGGGYDHGTLFLIDGSSCFNLNLNGECLLFEPHEGMFSSFKRKQVWSHKNYEITVELLEVNKHARDVFSKLGNLKFVGYNKLWSAIWLDPSSINYLYRAHKFMDAIEKSDLFMMNNLLMNARIMHPLNDFIVKVPGCEINMKMLQLGVGEKLAIMTAALGCSKDAGRIIADYVPFEFDEELGFLAGGC